MNLAQNSLFFVYKNMLRWCELANKTVPRGQYVKLTTLHDFFHNGRLESKLWVQYVRVCLRGVEHMGG